MLHEPQNLVSGQRQSQQHRQSLRGEGGRGREGGRKGGRDGRREGERDVTYVHCSRSTGLRMLVDLWLCHNRSYT